MVDQPVVEQPLVDQRLVDQRLVGQRLVDQRLVRNVRGPTCNQTGGTQRWSNISTTTALQMTRYTLLQSTSDDVGRYGDPGQAKKNKSQFS